jgi:phage protein D
LPNPPANAVRVAAEGRELYSSFYVPAFEIRIKGRSLPRDVVRDVMQVTYKDNVNEIDSFELTINNWDADARDFKYAGIEGMLSGEDGRTKTLGMFDPGQEMEIWMGYAGNLRLMVSGQITSLEPNFPQSGAPSLAVRGLNALHQLRRKQYTDSWPAEHDKQGQREGVRDSDIALDIDKKMDIDKKKGGQEKRFPLPIRINPAARDAEPLEHYVFQNNQYDIVFLLTRARLHGYVVYVDEVEKNGQKRKELYFGPSEGNRPGDRDVTYLLEWGKSLIQFKPTLTTAKQIGSVTVRGWDRKAKKPIEATVRFSDLKINRDLGDIAQEFNQREEIITEPVYTQAQAKARATDILKNQLKEMVKGSGSTIGLPDLRAGRKVFIAGLGDRYSGTYFITETTHAIGDGGYQTTFNARREQESEGKK